MPSRRGELVLLPGVRSRLHQNLRVRCVKNGEHLAIIDDASGAHLVFVNTEVSCARTVERIVRSLHRVRNRLAAAGITRAAVVVSADRDELGIHLRATGPDGEMRVPAPCQDAPARLPLHPEDWQGAFLAAAALCEDAISTVCDGPERPPGRAALAYLAKRTNSR